MDAVATMGEMEQAMITDEIYEMYMDPPDDGKFDAFYVARDIYRLLGYIEGLRDGARLAPPAADNAQE